MDRSNSYSQFNIFSCSRSLSREIRSVWTAGNDCNRQRFTSNEFETFLQRNGIRHITTAPYHPASNCLAERAVQVVKARLKKNKNGTFRSRLSVTLASYRLTPHATTGKAPCELLIGRRYRSRLDLLRPNTAEKVEKQLLKQKQNHDTTVKLRKFDTGDKVFVRNPLNENKWIPGVIVSSQGNVSYSVQLDAGRIRKCHVDQLRERHAQMKLTTVPPPVVDIPVSRDPVTESVDGTEPSLEQNTQSETEPPVDSRDESEPARKQYTPRVRKPVQRYDPSFE